MKQNEILLDRPLYLGFAVLEVSKLLMYATFYDKLHLYFGKETFQILSIDTDSFSLSMNSSDFIKDLIKIEDLFDFRNLNDNHDFFSNKNKKACLENPE